MNTQIALANKFLANKPGAAGMNSGTYVSRPADQAPLADCAIKM